MAIASLMGRPSVILASEVCFVLRCRRRDQLEDRSTDSRYFSSRSLETIRSRRCPQVGTITPFNRRCLSASWIDRLNGRTSLVEQLKTPEQRQHRRRPAVSVPTCNHASSEFLSLLLGPVIPSSSVSASHRPLKEHRCEMCISLIGLAFLDV